MTQARSGRWIAILLVLATGGVLAASIFPRDARRAASAIAIYFAGGGLGLLISAITLPLLLHARGDAAWPEAWLLLADITVKLFCLAFFREKAW